MPWAQVLLLLFGEKACMWCAPWELLPFKRAALEKQAEGAALIEARKMPRAALFGPAVQVGAAPLALPALPKPYHSMNRAMIWHSSFYWR